MPKLSNRVITVDLTLEEVNTLTIVLGQSNGYKNVEDGLEVHGFPKERIADNGDLYAFFLSHSESTLKK